MTLFEVTAIKGLLFVWLITLWRCSDCSKKHFVIGSGSQNLT